MHEASLYTHLGDGRVRCALCAHRCTIAQGNRGICNVRENRDGVLYSLVYGQPVSEGIDPIEKKPLFHVLPGTQALSLATIGCNFRCLFCQNASISQNEWSPRDVVPTELVVRAALQHRCASIAYTYTEPTVFFEYTADIGRLAQEAGLLNVYVTNGYMTTDMLAQANFIDAANVDLKSYRDEFYREYCGARLQPVLDSLIQMKRQGIWVEVTTLIIPELNDSAAELGDIARFIRDELGPETPWHVSRFHPTYKMMDRPPTPVTTIQRARQTGLDQGLKYVYEGNVPGSHGETTFCPACGEAVIERQGFTILANSLIEGACPVCSHKIDGLGL